MVPPRRLLTALALVALIGAGCANAPAGTGNGGGEKPATTGAPDGTGGGDRDDPAAAAPVPSALRELQEKLPEYAACMRESGVEDFPDPGADGTVQYYGDADPVEFRSASEKCDDLLPEDRGPNR